MAGKARHRLEGAIDRFMAAASLAFIDAWAVVERGYRRPLSWFARHLRYAFYPLLAVAMVGWLAWDWHHGRSLDAAEDAIFDNVISWRLAEPAPSGRTVVVEIDDCSIEYYRARGEGGWPWPRERHADLLDALDRAGARAAGFDVLFMDPSPDDPGGDALLEAMATGGKGRFLFAASRLHPDFDAAATLRAADVPGAFGLVPDAAPPGPRVALARPYGTAMARHAGLVNIRRGSDGMLRDVRLYEAAGDWALPSLVLRLAQAAGTDTAAALSARSGDLRVNWREHSHLPYASAADIIEGKPVCGRTLPPLRGVVAVVGHTAAGVEDAKPTPVNMAMPGVEVLAEAVEALVADTWIRMPPGWLKYALATLLVLLSTFVFWRGEPHKDVDPAFFGANLLLVAGAFAGLTWLGWFVDIFASLGYGALCFGLCRGYATVQRKRTAGNVDYVREYDPVAQPWLLLVRLRFEAEPSLPRQQARRRRREYRRVLRRFLYRGEGIVLIEGVVERKHWLQAILDDTVLLLWHGESEAGVRARARRDLDALHAALDRNGERLDHDSRVLACASAMRIGGDDIPAGDRRRRLRALLGQDLDRLGEWPLAADNLPVSRNPPREEHDPCDSPSAS
ncbi:MAG TPA: CHASE2 domain-containing protein [Luteimonas sp.]|nr:CHASE2 domain-containing protein [Luteimonas sp.]